MLHRFYMRTYLTPIVDWRSVTKPDTKIMEETRAPRAGSPSWMQRNVARMMGLAMVPPIIAR